MANHKSAEKEQDKLLKTERNRFYRTRLKNITKAVREAAANGNKNAANEALKVANKSIHAMVSRGFIKNKLLLAV